MDYLKKSRIEEVLIAILGKGTVTSQLISRIEKILDAIRVKGSYDGIVMSEVEEILVCILLGERFEKPTHSRIAAMLKVKANGGEYTELRKSRVEELIFEWIEGTSKIITYMGTLPATLQTVAGYLVGYKIWGNTGGVGGETENLWNGTFTLNYHLDTTTGLPTAYPGETRMATLAPIDVSEADRVTIKFVNLTATPFFVMYSVMNEDGELLRRVANRTAPFSFSVADGAALYLALYKADEDISVDEVADIMLLSTDSESEFIPYGYKLPILSNNVTTDIYIGDTQLAKDEYVDSSEGKIYKWAAITGLSEPLYGINSYADALDLSTGTLTRKIKKLVLTGSANDPIRKIGSNAPYAYYYSPTGMEGRARQACLCTHTPFSWSYSGETPAIIISTNLGHFFINFGKTTMDAQPSGNTVEGFKEFCAAQYAAGTPVTIWYVLAEPEISTVPVPSGLTGTIEGYLIQNGTPTPENPIYPTANGTKQADGTYSIESVYLTPTDPPTPFPQIPTFTGETTIDYGAAALPYTTGLDGIFEYGNIDGLTWKNSVSGENDITFDTAVTDTGAEYVLPAGATGQYTSKSGEYRTVFTWYCVAKCPTTCYSAGQYMISDFGNGIGVEISSGWAAYSSAGGNHLVRSVDNRDYNSQMPVTSYALIVVSGDVNGVASVYVNGEKMTDSWNFNPVPSDRADTIFLGKRASSQLSGTDIDYKFLALGATKQTDAEITANSQYLMTKYLGVGRPEKVELTYKTP